MLILLVGYVLLVEDNQWLRYVAVKAVLLCLSFPVLSAAIGLIPDFLGLIESITWVFNETFNYGLVSKIVNVSPNALELVRVALLLLGVIRVIFGMARCSHFCLTEGSSNLEAER